MYARAPIPKREPPKEGGIEDLIGMPRWPAAIAVLATGINTLT